MQEKYNDINQCDSLSLDESHRIVTKLFNYGEIALTFQGTRANVSPDRCDNPNPLRSPYSECQSGEERIPLLASLV